MERWRAIVGFEGHYEISDHGRVRSLAREVAGRWGVQSRRTRIMRLTHRPDYLRVTLSLAGKDKALYVHVLVAEAFISIRPTPQHEVNHKDLDKKNNHFMNLEWLTHLQNVEHAHINGAMCARTNPSRYSKLTAKQVDAARILHAAGGVSYAELGRTLGVTTSAARSAILGITWR